MNCEISDSSLYLVRHRRTSTQPICHHLPTCNFGLLPLLITCLLFPLFWTFVGQDVPRVLFSSHQNPSVVLSVAVRHRPPSVGCESSLPLFFLRRQHGTPSWDQGSTPSTFDKNIPTNRYLRLGIGSPMCRLYSVLCCRTTHS